MAERKRRLRKKLRVGEFQEFGFAFSASIAKAEDQDAMLDRFVDEIAARGLVFGGWSSPETVEGFISLATRGSATEEHRQFVESWLKAQPGVEDVEVGELVDANY